MMINTDLLQNIVCMYNDSNIPDGVGDEKKKLTVVVLISKRVGEEFLF